MSDAVSVTVRVTGIRSQNPRGFGGAIFTGVPIDAAGSVIDACAYVVVKASRTTLGSTDVERGQWWQVSGRLTERQAVVDGFELTEKQVDADTAHLALPSGEHIVSFLAGNPAFEGIGLVKARRLWERHGDLLYGLLDAGDSSVFTDLLTEQASHNLVAAWAEQGQSQSLQWLQSHGFDLSLGRKVLRFFGAETHAQIETDPYRLLSFTGKWADVDALALNRFGVDPADPRRLLGAIEEACYRIFANGHTAMRESDLAHHVIPLLGQATGGIRWQDLLARALSDGLTNGSFVRTAHGLQPLGALVMERQVAKAIHKRLANPGVPVLDATRVEELIAESQIQNGIELNLEQKEAIHLAVARTFACMTGGAGVGKTTVLKSLYRIYDVAGVRVLQVALAGRAAKRMQEATGRPATTIASFLKTLTDATFEGPTVLVIDEASMVDIISMSRVCEALPSHVRLLLAGDPYQLMPVGPGLVLHCLMQLPQIPMVELKTVKRYGGEIAAVASSVRAGAFPSVGTDPHSPIAFIPCHDSDIAAMVADLYAAAPAQTQVLAPLRNGLAGTKALNALCQSRFTAHEPAVTSWNDEFDRPELCGLHLGDIVLCTRNLWEHGLQNGSLGRVVEVEGAQVSSPGERNSVLAWVEWDDGIRRVLSEDMLDDVELGYAVTVHKAQGSQWPRIIIPVTRSKFLDRTLLYTAITRAQTQVILVGDLEAARRAVQAAPKAHGRRVALHLTLMQYLDAANAPGLAAA